MAACSDFVTQFLDLPPDSNLKNNITVKSISYRIKLLKTKSFTQCTLANIKKNYYNKINTLQV